MPKGTTALLSKWFAKSGGKIFADQLRIFGWLIDNKSQTVNFNVHQKPTEPEMTIKPPMHRGDTIVHDVTQFAAQRPYTIGCNKKMPGVEVDESER